MDDKHIYRVKLDFLYQSIAMYAVTIVIYLLARSFIWSKAFPSVWQDPLLLLLCGITIVSVIALLYNIFMQRQIVVHPDRIEFASRARNHQIAKKDVREVHFGREPSLDSKRGVRVVKLYLTNRRRPVRIRLLNFEHGKRLLGDLKQWAGPLATAPKSRFGRISRGGIGSA